MREKKPFRETKVGKVLIDKAPQVLDMVGDILPDQGALGLVKNIISKDDSISESEKAAIIAEVNQELELLRLENEDRASARSRDVEVTKAGGDNLIMKTVAFTMLGLLVLCVVAVLFFDLKNENLAHLIVGEIFGAVLAMVVYYFGSTRGSKEKTSLIEKLFKQ